MQNALPDGIYSLTELANRLKGDVWQLLFRTVNVLTTVEMKRRVGTTTYKIKRKLSACSSDFLVKELKRRGAERDDMEREPKEFLS